MPGELTVLGAGSWGTVLAYLFGQKGEKVRLWARSRAASEAIQQDRTNDRYLPGLRLPDTVECTWELEKAVAASGIVVLAVPSFAVEETCRLLQPSLHPDALIVSGAKGLESSTGRRLSEIVEEAIPGIGPRLAVLSGPNLAREIARDMPTASVVAAHNPEAAAYIQHTLSLPQFRIYTNPDVVGVELGGALKNIVAIGAGIINGLGYGENTKATLVSRGLTEIRRLGRALGALDATFSGLSGIGDLYATCASSQSRNHHVGYELGLGRNLKDILKGMDQISEGVLTIQAAAVLARKTGVEMPITLGLHAILFQGACAREAVLALMARAHSAEDEG